MKNRPAYVKLRQAVIDKGYTIQQVRNATAEQAVQLAGVTKAEVAPYLEGMKERMIAEMQAAIENAKMELVKQQFKSWLDSNFSDNVIERDATGGKPYLVIWPEGKP